MKVIIDRRQRTIVEKIKQFRPGNLYTYQGERKRELKRKLKDYPIVREAQYMR